MMLPLSPHAQLASLSTHAALRLPAFVIRGGATAGAAAFDVGLENTRLDGLAYSTISAFLITFAIDLFVIAPRNIERLPDGDASKVRAAKLSNTLKILFGLSMSFSVALGSYSTILFSLITVYSKTALGMNLQDEYIDFLKKTAWYRHMGFMSFFGMLMTYNVGWILCVILSYEGNIRWWMAVPAVLVGLMSIIHFNNIMRLAGSILF